MLKDYSSDSAKNIITVIIIVVFAFGVLFYFSNKEKNPLSQEKIISKQMEELRKLRQEAAKNPLTQAEEKKQAEELDKLKKQNQVPMSQEETSKQMKELDNLKLKN